MAPATASGSGTASRNVAELARQWHDCTYTPMHTHAVLPAQGGGADLVDGQRKRGQRRGVAVGALQDEPLVERLQHAAGSGKLLVVERRDESLDEVSEAWAVEGRPPEGLGACGRVQVRAQVVAALHVGRLEGGVREAAEGGAVEVRLRQADCGGAAGQHGEGGAYVVHLHCRRTV